MIQWLIVLAIAVGLGWVTSLLMRRIGMGPVVCIPIALIGAVLGGVLYHVYNPASELAFFAFALFLTLLALGGGVYAYILTGTEKRI